MKKQQFVQNDDFKKKAMDIFSGQLIKVKSDGEIVALITIVFRHYGITSYDVQEKIDIIKQWAPITYIAMNEIYGCPLIAFFHYNFYTKYRVALGKYRIASICAINGMDPEVVDDGSCYVRNIGGVYYYCIC